MNKHVLESLNEYKDWKFFSALVEKKVENPEEAKQAEEQKKDAEAILKKVQDNFSRFQSAAGGKIQAYKSFWDHITSMSSQISEKHPAIKTVYPLYDSNYAVVLLQESEDATPSLAVWKYNLEEDEENPIFTAKNPEISSEFVEFMNNIKEQFKEVKDKYVRDVDSKKKEEEREKKRKKFDSFLKESKNVGKKKLNEEFFEDLFTPHGYLTFSNWGGIEIELSKDGDGVRYRYTDDEVYKEAEIEYDEEGRAYFSDIGTEEDRRFYLDEFIRVNESQTKKRKLNEWSSSYDEFIDNYAEELGEIKRMFKEIQERMQLLQMKKSKGYSLC